MFIVSKLEYILSLYNIEKISRKEIRKYMPDKYSKLDELIEVLKKDEKKTGKKYYYRGQINDWPIASSASRVDYNVNEMEKTKFFVSKLKKNQELNSQKYDNCNNKCLAIAQHYGYKTDLIDFTTNIEVAAFFATDGIEKNSKFKYGYLWRITEEEIEDIKACFKIIFEDFLSKNCFNKEQIEEIKVIKNNKYNPFFEISIPQLSRMNNQKGVFLHDLFGIFTKYWFNGREPDYKFEHNGQIYSSETINKDVIYPKPNVLELEIERFKSVEAANSLKKSDIYNKLTKVTIEPVNSITAEYLKENEWTKDFVGSLNKYETKIKKSKKEKINLKNDDKKLESIINKNKTNIKSGSRILVDTEDEKLDNLINEAIEILVYYPYTVPEIKKVIENISSLYYENSSIENNKMNLKIGIKDSFGTESYAYIPYKIINKIIGKKRIEIKNNCKSTFSVELIKLLDEQHTWNLFLDLNRFPKKVFEFSEIKEIFVEFILPYQFVNRSREFRIYIPTFLEIFGPE